ncbi:thioredoxin [Gaoshiqia sp. Z1-71]|uniref:thioredoxin n=1 Tax=Gaoshiqia hydrogeniformans TaxID=3290090 RepID=UPI003BF880B8
MRANNRFIQIIKSEKPVLVDFYADWCQPCKQIQPVLKDMKTAFKENIRILKVNVDQNPLIANQFQVKSIPTLILFKSGNIKWTNEGLVPGPELAAVISQYLAEY